MNDNYRKEDFTEFLRHAIVLTITFSLGVPTLIILSHFGLVPHSGVSRLIVFGIVLFPLGFIANKTTLVMRQNYREQVDTHQ